MLLRKKMAPSPTKVIYILTSPNLHLYTAYACCTTIIKAAVLPKIGGFSKCTSFPQIMGRKIEVENNLGLSEDIYRAAATFFFFNVVLQRSGCVVVGIDLEFDLRSNPLRIKPFNRRIKEQQ